jgi:hypothetical protein
MFAAEFKLISLKIQEEGKDACRRPLNRHDLSHENQGEVKIWMNWGTYRCARIYIEKSEIVSILFEVLNQLASN